MPSKIKKPKPKDPNLMQRRKFGRRTVDLLRSPGGGYTVVLKTSGNVQEVHNETILDDAAAIFMEMCDWSESQWVEILEDAIKAGVYRKSPSGEAARVKLAYQELGDIDKVCMSTGIKKRRVAEILEKDG